MLVYDKNGIEIFCGDSLEILREAPDNCVDLILTDPPYFKVKNEAWDRQWDKPEEFIAWIGKLCQEWRRVLRPNGSLYVFASPKMSARVKVEIGKWFNVLNRVTWRKHDGTANEGGLWSRARKTSLRRFFEQKEEIIFAEHHGADNIAKGEAGYGAKCDELRGFVFEPLRAYLETERKRAGIDKADCNVACGFSHSAGGMASRHYFSRSQWCLPTQAHYEAMRALFNTQGGDYLRREYEDLRHEYEDLRRPFSVTSSVPYTDVWDFPTVQHYPGKHPCEKPAPLLEHIIQASSRPGALVLDSFMSTGSTGLACQKLGRQFVGMDLSKDYCEIAAKRLSKEEP